MDLIRRYLIVMIFLLFCAPFVFGIAESSDLGKNDIKVDLSYISKLHGNFNVKKFRLNHPVKISHAEIVNQLVSLRYKGTFLGNKEEPVFSKPEIKKLAPLLKKMFEGVTPDKIIHIELKSEGGITSGDIFSFRKHLNWRFDSIHGEEFFQRNDLRGWNIFAWKLIPHPGQLYFKSGAEKGKRIRKNWIVAKIQLPVPGQQNVEEGEPSKNFKINSSNEKFNPELEKKLEHLKYLHDRKLLDDEEYKIQQNKLFEELL